MKVLKFLLAMGAICMCSSAMAEVTTVYSIDLTNRTENPFQPENTQVTMDDKEGLVHTGNDQFQIASGISVNDAQFYTVKAEMKCSEDRNVHLYFSNWGTDCGSDVALTTEWQTVSFMTQAQATGNYFISVQHWGWDGTVSVKSVTITTGDEPYDSNLLCLTATNIEKKENKWDNQISYELDTKLDPGTYNIAFDICGDGTGKANIDWGLGAKYMPEATSYNAETPDAWIELWGGTNPIEHREAEFDVAETWKHYEFTYTVDESGVYNDEPVNLWLGVVKFEFGNNYDGNTLYIDNVVLRKAGYDEDIIPNGDFNRLALNKWSKGYQHTFDLAISNGPEHPAVTRVKDANSVWFGEKVMNWGDGVTIDASVFSDLEYGDKLKFEYGDDRYVQIIFGGWSGCNTSPWEGIYAFKEEGGKNYAEIEITEALANFSHEEGEGEEATIVNYNIYDLLKTGGIAIQGGGNTLYEVIYIPVNKVAFVDAENSISFNTNYAGKDGEYWVVNNLKLKDGVKYQAAHDFTAKNVEYTRNFANSEWQALYVPFDIAYSEWSEKGEVAVLTSVANNEGKISLEWNTVSTGSLTPNTPYIFKPKATGEVTFTATNKSVKANANESLSKSPVTLTGIYTTKTDMATDNAYGLSNGSFYKTNSDDKTLKPFRFYLKVAGSLSAPLRIDNTIDDVNVSGIEDILIEDTDNGIYYDLNGRVIENPTTGVYINNGNKVIIR